ncbi:hypothetical protein [Superficieibacter sp. HKU1]|uniref:hypothetical protein n=1 Tax=Superficieibacter sp. HKU1 TaxID=3031919 RepID=UPI0023E0E5AF|nr:hypothetical protein [Superficieibacter sp. HKU1]WES68027.1 hypothetical protein P0H77_20880 [Superficieibacter sp. HKU1]
MPAHDNASQIKYYDQSSNANTDDAAKGYSDIFVVSGHTGGYYQQGDWQPGQAQFRDLKGITGNGGVAQGDAGKDYIFVSGNSENYNVSYSSNNNASSQNNTYDGLKITDKTTGKGLYENANHIEGVIFGNGTTSSSGTTTTTVTTTTVQHITVDIHLALASDITDAHLTQITLTGIPEGATFTGNHSAVSWDQGVYTLTLNGSTFDGQLTVDLPEGQSKLGDITLGVDSTVADHHQTEFTINGENGTHYDNSDSAVTADEHHSDATAHTLIMSHEDSADTSHDHTDAHEQTDDHSRQADTQSDSHEVTQHETVTPDEDHQTAGLIDDSELHLSQEPGSATVTEADTRPATPEDTSLSNLLDDSQDDRATTPEHAQTATVDHAEADHGVASILTTDGPIQLSDVVSDADDGKDLTSLIPTIEPGPATDHSAGVEANTPAVPDATPAESYHAVDESLVENLIAKPEELHG